MCCNGFGLELAMVVALPPVESSDAGTIRKCPVY